LNLQAKFTQRDLQLEMKTQPPGKHLAYYELLETLQQARECPLCEGRRSSVRRYLASLLYESVNDPDFRRRLRAARGFCPRHAALLLDFEKGLPVALWYADQLEEALDFLARLRQSKRKPDGGEALKKGQAHPPCPVCEWESENERLRCSTLLKYLDDDELRQALEAGPGLCLPHLLEVLAATKSSEAWTYLIELHQRKLAALASEVKEFLRKQDYRFASEGFGAEADSWRRAVKALLGADLD